jgi:hypothetical protein
MMKKFLGILFEYFVIINGGSPAEQYWLILQTRLRQYETLSAIGVEEYTLTSTHSWV